MRYIEINRGYDTPCWEWQMCRRPGGYGQLGVNGRTTSAHIHYYEMRHGPVPEGMQLDHLCRNRACVNPDHLEPVSCAENIRRGRVPKLTREDVAHIRAMKGAAPMLSVARQFGVTRWTISRIWRDVQWVGVGMSHDATNDRTMD